jgi:spermidine/putrescine transport system permease protein
MRRTDLLWRGLGVVFMVFMLTPLLLLVLFAFTDGGLAAFPIDRLSLRWWRAMIADPEFLPALENSLIVAVAVGAIAAVVGTMAALGLARMSPARAQATAAVLCLPLMLPPLLLALSLLTFYTRAVGIPLTLATVIMGHLLFALPFVVLVVYARLRNFDFHLVECARDLGASPWQAFFTVTLPIIRPTVVGAALIAVSLSIDDFIITNFTIGGGVTLPTFVWGMIRTSLTPAANAVGTLILVMTVGTTLLALRLTRYRG